MILLRRLHASVTRHHSVPLQFDFSCLRCFSQWDVARSCWSPVHVCSHTRLSGWPHFWSDRVKVHTVLEISVTAHNVYLTMSVYDCECNETLTEQPATGHLLLNIIVCANHCCQLKRRDMRLRPTCGDRMSSHLFSLLCCCYFTSQYFIFLPGEIFSSDRAPLRIKTSTKQNNRRDKHLQQMDINV